ncbi:MAG: 4-hydroxy-tetrahydrodipicolinate synthase [Halofilum sp. (in: g-proteobacteria)]|nr:4-hydroxy-tetrahydrodipicolinate synthase [Halofilum sp. (in: g-proteobacteria)]
MYQGSMVALVTPMHADGSLDDAALARLVEFHVDNGTDAIISVGTTGESPTLTPTEHIDVIRRTIELVAGRMPVLAGAGGNSTAEAIDLARAAEGVGAEATLQVVPYYNKPTQEGMYRHFVAVAEAVSIPHILYNVPGRTGADLLAETVERLSHVENIVGIKEATGDPERTRAIVEACGDRIEVYSGEDSTAMESILAGGRGDISVTANVAPRLMHEMCMKAFEGDRAGAEALNRQLDPLHRELFCQSSPIPAKWALHEMGLIEEGIRLPLVPLEPQYHEQVREAMRHAGVL